MATLSVSCRDGDCEHWPLLLLLWGVEIEESKANEMGEGNDRQLAERRRRHTASPAVRSDGYHASGDAGDTTGIGLSDPAPVSEDVEPSGMQIARHSR